MSCSSDEEIEISVEYCGSETQVLTDAVRFKFSIFKLNIFSIFQLNIFKN